MEERKTFTYNGVNSADYGLYISGDYVYNAPSRVYEMVDIAGRNGQLAIDQGRFENIEVTYPAFIFAETQTEFAQRLREIRAWLMSPVGYQRLEDTYHPDEFRLGIYKSGLEAEPIFYNKAGRFELIFDCKPQRFLFSGEETFVLGEWGETETITGNIVTFEGTDTTAIKSVVANIVPVQEGTGDPSPDNVRPISGWSGVNVGQSGKNLFDMSDLFQGTHDGLVSNNNVTTNNYISVKGGTQYTLTTPAMAGRYIRFYDESKTEITGTRITWYDGRLTHTFTTPNNAVYMRFMWFSTSAISVAEISASESQIELGTTATAYEPYQGTSKSIPFKDSEGNPITVYGGEIDVVSGKLIIEWAKATATGQESWQKNGTTNMYYSNSLTPDRISSTSGVVISSHFKESDRTDVDLTFFNGGALNFCYNNTTTETAWKEWLAEQYANGTPLEVSWKLATPIEIQLTPTEIKSLDGVNNIWADTGDVSVEIGEDPNILVNPTPFEALPVFEVVGTGSLTVGNTTINITGDSTQDIFIDSDIMEAYEDDNGAIISRNDRINLSGTDFPKLGEETRAESNGLTSVKITPRWWTI